MSALLTRSTTKGVATITWTGREIHNAFDDPLIAS